MEYQNPDPEERERAGIARNQNVLYVLPHDAAAVAQFLDPALERIDPGDPATQVLVLTPEADTAIAVAEAATRSRATAPVRVLPVTAARRAARLLRERAAAVVAGSPAELLELVRGSALKLGGVRALIIAWADAIGDAGLMDALEAVMVEVPKDAARAIVTARMTPAVETVVERYARRARRAGEVETSTSEPIDLRYVVVAPQSRPTALRRLLDDLDPERAAVYARAAETASDLTTLARALGYSEGHPGLVVTRGEPAAGASLVVLFELPPSRDALRALAMPGATVIALITPRQLPALRTLAGAGRLTPYTLSGAAARARAHDEHVREELRAILADGLPARELLTVEPLLEDYDGVEVAGAALRLLAREREREHERAVIAAATPVPDAPSAVASTDAPAPRGAPAVRIFINAGTRDNIAPRDIVGAIANEAGVPGDRIGRIDLRENHALVEIPAELAEQVVTRLGGVVLRGRRIVARIDQKRAPGRGARDREARPRSGREERSPRSSRPGHPPRGRSE